MPRQRLKPVGIDRLLIADPTAAMTWRRLRPTCCTPDLTLNVEIRHQSTRNGPAGRCSTEIAALDQLSGGRVSVHIDPPGRRRALAMRRTSPGSTNTSCCCGGCGPTTNRSISKAASIGWKARYPAPNRSATGMCRSPLPASPARRSRWRRAMPMCSCCRRRRSKRPG